MWLMPAAFIVAAAARTKGGLSYAGYIMLGVYVLLTMVLNYEILGKVRWEILKSYHHLGFAMLILFGLLLRNNGPSSDLQLSFRNMRPRVPKVVGGR